MLGRLAVPKGIYVRPAGGPENTSNIGENPNINSSQEPLNNAPFLKKGLFSSGFSRGKTAP